MIWSCVCVCVCVCIIDNGAYLKKSIDKRKPVEPNARPILFRVLFTLGLLSKHFDVESAELTEYKVSFCLYFKKKGDRYIY